MEEKNEIYGIETIIGKSEEVEFEGKIYTIREMNVHEYLKFSLGEYQGEGIDRVVTLVNACTNSSFNFNNLTDADILAVTFLFNGIILIQAQDKEKIKESDYNFKMDYSFIVLKVMKVYNYNLEDVYKLPNSIFWNMFNKIKVFEAEEDLRKIKIETAVKSADNKNSDHFSQFTRGLSKTIESVMKFKITAKANLKKWRQFTGLDEIKERVKEEEKP